MEQIQLNILLEFVYPEVLALLTDYEKNISIVLQYGFGSVKAEDAQEIVEAVIMEQGKTALIH
ncbi:MULTISPECIES: hypothetical protein [Sinobaca]|uniref:Uncharacterized protein n=1 Tax=Sinobaca qinghaiensis TaxID=342944 RepID=A0A419UVX8_9BACL|nr:MULTISPECIES: hypothetical protein [Sinobaca]RKD68755.1 hypothetical protein ATL39_3217 [Sinobaca qinghaiensis]